MNSYLHRLDGQMQTMISRPPKEGRDGANEASNSPGFKSSLLSRRTLDLEPDAHLPKNSFRDRESTRRRSSFGEERTERKERKRTISLSSFSLSPSTSIEAKTHAPSGQTSSAFLSSTTTEKRVFRSSEARRRLRTHRNERSQLTF